MKFTGEKSPWMEALIVARFAEAKTQMEASVYWTPAVAAYFEKLDSELVVELSPRMKSCAGKAFIKRHLIKLHYKLLSETPSELVPTFVHELAHLVTCNAIDPRCSHGAMWQAVMRYMGAEPTRCHKMNVSPYKTRQRRNVWACKCEGQAMRLASHNHRVRMQAYYGVDYFKCSKCEAPKLHIGKEASAPPSDKPLRTETFALGVAA